MKKVIVVLLIVCILVVIGVAVYSNQKRNDEKSNIQTESNVEVNTQEKNNVEENKVNTEEILLSVMNNKSKLIDESNNEILFKNIEIPGEEVTNVDKYTFIDLDKDGTEELVIYTTADYGAYVILHYENSKIYGYVIDVRSFENLKTDGSFIGSNGANSNEYLTISFNKNKYDIKTEAINDGTNEIYKINGNEVSKNEIEEYAKNWETKENVVWTKK